MSADVVGAGVVGAAGGGVAGGGAVGDWAAAVTGRPHEIATTAAASEKPANCRAGPIVALTLEARRAPPR